MLNNVILVGRTVEEPTLTCLESGYKVSNVVLACQKPFRNENNEFETDFIPIHVWGKLAEIVTEYVGKGSIVGFKCRLQTKLVEVKDIKMRCIDVVGEKIAFISLAKRSNKEELIDSDSDPVIILDKDLSAETPVEASEVKKTKSKK